MYSFDSDQVNDSLEKASGTRTKAGQDSGYRREKA
jgi:hypothetical protein